MIPAFEKIAPFLKTAPVVEFRPAAPVLPSLLSGAANGTRRLAVPELVYKPRPVNGYRHLSEARRIELMLLPRMLYETIVKGASDRTHPDAIRMQGLLADCIVEAITGLTAKQAEKLCARMNRESDSLYLKSCGGWFDRHFSMGKVGLTLFYLCCDMSADGTIELYEQSAFTEALRMMWSAVEDESRDKPEVDLSARKQAVKFRRFLNDRGYFRGP